MSDASAGAVKWTREQRLAIETIDRSLLVSAAAGSGKTAVLAERCAYLVCDAPVKCDVDELLVVTFTRAAAEEMRNRIEHALHQRLTKSQDDVRLLRQLMLLERAQINTVHGFCTSVLRRHFNVVGLDPNFSMLDEEEANLLRIETARDLLERRYESDHDGRFQQFVDQYADGNDQRILGHILRTHDLLSSVIDPAGWLARARQRVAQVDQQPLHTCALGIELAASLKEKLHGLERRCVGVAETIMRLGGLDEYVEYVNELRATVEAWQHAFGEGSFDALSHELAEIKLARLPIVPASPAKELAQELINSVRREMKEGSLYNVCRFTTQQWCDGLRQIVGPCEVLVDLVREFGDAYRAAKNETSSLDFSDLERMALEVLRARGPEGATIPSAAARAYHRQFAHVLVDEYQDINELQDEILRLVSRECVEEGQKAEGRGKNLFCVGDVKQSIYRFRLADPRRFMQRDKRFRESADGSNGQVIDLQANFRSRGPLLDAINGVFERLMSLDAAEIHYDESHRLKPGLDYPKPAKGKCFAGAPIELHMLPQQAAAENDGEASEEDSIDLDRTEREAAFVARRVRELLGLDGASPPVLVFDKSLDAEPKLRPIQFKDVVILLRSMRYKSNQYVDALRAAGIPVHSESGTGFFESMEVRDVLALLAVLDNAQQDIPLAALLRSPLSGLAQPEDGMARLRLAYRDEPFHRAAVRYAHEQHDELAAHLRDFLADVATWRTLAHQRPLAEVLWQIYDQTGYLAFCSGLGDGEQRVANLVNLHERARQFGTFQKQGLRRFITFLQTLQDEHDLGQPSTASEADNVVRVMSIHRSKGLEFPVVILPDLGKKHNLQDTAGPILIDRESGLGLACVDEEKCIRYPSLAWLLVQERIRKQSLAEEMRVLYVAMTRAREHLILVGTCRESSPQAWKERWSGYSGTLPAEDVLRGSTFLDWLGPVAAAVTPDAIETTVHSAEEVAQFIAPSTQRPTVSELQQKLARLEPLDPPPAASPDADLVRARLTWRYPHAWYAQRPAVMTVGALTKEGKLAPGGESGSRESIVPFKPELASPRCVQATLTLSPTDIGSATHLILEHLDFQRSCSRDDLKHQIGQLVDRKVIAPAHAAAVDVDSLDWMMNQTDLGALLRRNATSIRRELRIFYPLAIPPPDVPDSAVDPLDRIMVRGRIDALVPVGGGLTVVDYKTDRVTKETIDARAAFYADQVRSYREAISAIAGRPVTRVYLVFLAAREIRQS